MAEGFEKLKIWQTGYELVLKIANVVSKFPEIQKYGLTVQLLKSSNSIIANIAESQGRYTFVDKVRVMYIARGELLETMSHLKVAYGLQYIDESLYTELTKEYTALLITINGYIKFLSEKQQSE